MGILRFSGILFLGWANLLPGAELTVDLQLEGKLPAVGLIWVDGPPAPVQDLHLTQKNRTFIPGLVVGPQGSTVIVDNADNQTHNVFTTDAGLDVDLGLAPPQQSVRQQITWGEGTFVRFGCKIHPDMQLWIGSVASRLRAEVAWDAARHRGTAVLAGITAPAVIHVWLPRYEPLTLTLQEAALSGDLVLRGNKRGTATVGWK